MKHPGDWRARLVDVLQHGSRREKVAVWVWIAATVSTWIWCLALIPMLGWATIILLVATPFVTLAELRWFLRRRKALPFSERVELCVNQVLASGGPGPAEINKAVQAWRRKNDLKDRDRLAKAVYKKLDVKDPYRVQTY